MIQEISEPSDLQRFNRFMSEYASKRPLWRTTGPAGTLLKSGAGMIALFFTSIMFPISPSVHIVAGWLLLLSGFGLLAAGGIQGTRSQRLELRQLVEQTQDIQLIPPLVSLASGSNSVVRETFRSEGRLGLLRLLPLIQVEDARNLDTLQWKWLYYQLQGSDVALAEAIIQAIIRCGRTQALHYVEPLAKGKGLAKRATGLQELAQACVQTLQEQIDYLNAPQSLLRAGTLPDSLSGSKELLRPTVETVETALHQLLRASDKKDDLED